MNDVDNENFIGVLCYRLVLFDFLKVRDYIVVSFIRYGCYFGIFVFKSCRIFMVCDDFVVYDDWVLSWYLIVRGLNEWVW